MAGDWMKIEHCTPDKPEILAIAARIGTHPDHAFGTCFRMWRWFDLHTQNGNAPGVTTALLNQLLGVTGFAEAALATGWLEACEIDGKPSLRLPNFDRHTGQTAKHRALTAKRVASHKRKSNGEGNAKGNDASVTSALPREEKRREEKSIKNKRAFLPPTVEEVRAFCESRTNQIDPEEFVAHYSANGWVQSSGRPVKDWQACVVTWEKRRAKDRGIAVRQPPAPPPPNQPIIEKFKPVDLGNMAAP